MMNLIHKSDCIQKSNTSINNKYNVIFVIAALLILPFGVQAYDAGIVADAGDSFAQSTLLSQSQMNTSLQGNLSTLDSNDFYQIHIPAGYSITIYLTHNSGNDFDLYLYENDSTAIESSFSTINNFEEVTSNGSNVNNTNVVFKIKRYSGSGNYSFHFWLYQLIPNISITNSDIVLTQQISMNPVIISNDGGTVNNWTISPNLPQGLEFNSSTLSISGTPSSMQSIVQYTLSGINNVGNSSLFFNITILPPPLAPPNITVNYSELILVQNIPMDEFVTTNIGGAIGLITINPILPNGLFFNNSNLTMFGIPTNTLNKTAFEINVSNSAGFFIVNINITIITQLSFSPPILNPTSMELNLFLNQAMPSHYLSNEGGQITNTSITPQLPNGILFDSASLSFSGTPLSIQNRSLYIINCSNSFGYVQYFLNITVTEQILPPLLSPKQNIILNYTNDPITPIFVENLGSPVQSWEISQTLPAGLIFNQQQKMIWGSTDVEFNGLVTIWGNNSAGSDFVQLQINISEEVLPPELTISKHNYLLTVNQQIEQIEIINLGGEVSTWSYGPQLPEGLVFSDGVISGTPNNQTNESTFIINASNSVGFSIVELTITIRAVTILPPDLIVVNTIIEIINNGSIDTRIFYNIGGDIDSIDISPQLPSNYFFDASTFTLQGNFGADSQEQVFTVNVSNSAGYSINYFSLTAPNALPEFKVFTTLNPIPVLLTHQSEMIKLFSSGEEIVEINYTERNNFDIIADYLNHTITVVIDNETGVQNLSLTITGSSGSVVTLNLSFIILEDFDGDHKPNSLLGYSSNILFEDNDDDGDGILDIEENNSTLDPLNPDTDGDGFCDGNNSVYLDDIEICGVRNIQTFIPDDDLVKEEIFPWWLCTLSIILIVSIIPLLERFSPVNGGDKKIIEKRLIHLPNEELNEEE